MSQSCLTKTCTRNVKTIQEWNQTTRFSKMMTQLCTFLSCTELNLVLTSQWGRCWFEMSLGRPWPRENAEPWWMNQKKVNCLILRYSLHSSSWMNWLKSAIRNHSECFHKGLLLDLVYEYWWFVGYTAEYIISIRYWLQQTDLSVFRITSNDINLPRLHRNSSRALKIYSLVHWSKL